MSEDEHNDAPGFTVVKVDRENHDTTSIYFAGPDMERFRKREAGQFGTIRLLRDGKWTEAHPFTISAAPEDDTLRMTIKNSGSFTSLIPEVQPGAPIACAGPFGQFCRGIADQREIAMIAGGVGITPFLSVLRHLRSTDARARMTLIWANKTYADAFAAAELEECTRTLDLRVVHVFSRVAEADRRPAPAFADGRPGEVRHEFGRIDAELLRRNLRALDAGFYLCGPPAMQRAVLDALGQCGVDPAVVRKEAFVFTPAPPPNAAR